MNWLEYDLQLAFLYRFYPVLIILDCVTDAYVTLEHQWCCVTLSADENMLVWRLCARIAIHGIVIGDLTVNLACLDKQQGSRVPNKTLFSLFSELAFKIRQHNSRAKLY